MKVYIDFDNYSDNETVASIKNKIKQKEKDFYKEEFDAIKLANAKFKGKYLKHNISKFGKDTNFIHVKSVTGSHRDVEMDVYLDLKVEEISFSDVLGITKRQSEESFTIAQLENMEIQCEKEWV